MAVRAIYQARVGKVFDREKWSTVQFWLPMYPWVRTYKGCMHLRWLLNNEIWAKLLLLKYIYIFYHCKLNLL